ncbi:NBR1-Ig-like domain-containing protein [Pelolinea submarina]|uniref:CARDB protein n=1 Tax=Pelolinea submarina TaxID=913107 RepID=A0A347ZQH9_9CHLR|nr:NBR1-Ig-like domain-containing protein [Pelolinea submarina]REG06110.1 CARDB protein [Pelolinea submarina]BBB47560.1 hypothetical protein Pelsub_P0787 [Pelolinea submarina]
MHRIYRLMSGWLALMLVIMACTISFGGGQDEETAIQTAIAQTLTAGGSRVEATVGTEPTLTLAPTNTIAAPPTNTPSPCNNALYISETVPDGTEFEVGENFTKTWRLKNVGTCTWNTNYKLKFGSGDKMGGPSSQNLAQAIGPNETVDISVALKAPGSAGTYKGVWQIVDDGGNTFVYNIWVEIKAVETAAPAEPDLTISEFSINPATPTQGENVHVRVRAHNAGTADSGGFKMEWYGLSTFASPSCNWNIVGGLVAGGSVLMECDYSFASWYPVNKTTIAYIDTDDQVDESSEGNNSASISPFGVNEP